MSKSILLLFQKINSLLWVYDIGKTGPLLQEAKALLTEMKDPFLQKIYDQYKGIYDELNVKEMQLELDEIHTFDNVESKNIFYSDANFSALLMIKNKYEADIRMVTSGEFQWSSIEHLQRISAADQASQNEVSAEKNEESDSGVVYELIFPNHSQRFGTITFTSSGITEGMLYSNNLNKSDAVDHSATCRLFIDLASKVYQVSSD